jgi:hypothetical protein
MAQDTESREDQAADEQANGGNGGRKAALRAAAIAAATGATAIAAKKALSKRDQSGEERPKSEPGSSDDESIVTDMLASGWDAAKNSLLPFAEDAAAAAGEWVGRNGPELLRDALVPRFIRGFERTRKSADTDE